MEDFAIEVGPREVAGSAGARRCRNAGFIPAVVYSRGQGGKAISLPGAAFVKMAAQVKSSQIFTFKSTLPEFDGKSALVKQVQRDAVRGTVLHVDFQEVSEFEEINVEVGLRFVGAAPGVKLAGGILSVARYELKISCLPKAIPQEIVVDVSALELGDSIHIRDIQIPQGVKVTEDPDESVVSVVAVHVQIEEPTAAAAVEGVPVEGEAAAEGAAAGAEPAAAEAAEKGPGDKEKGEKPGSEKKAKDK